VLIIPRHIGKRGAVRKKAARSEKREERSEEPTPLSPPKRGKFGKKVQEQAQVHAGNHPALRAPLLVKEGIKIYLITKLCFDN
jgi:hypothetical protein